MKSHYILITILIFFFNNILIWYQLNGQLVWDFWKSWKGITTSLLMGVPITALFWLATKYGYQGFGSLWSVRLMGFATGMLTYPIMTWLYLGEVVTLKTIISIVNDFNNKNNNVLIQGDSWIEQFVEKNNKQSYKEIYDFVSEKKI